MPFKSLQYYRSSGKFRTCGGFQTGMKYAYQKGYDCAVQFDADGQHRPEYIAAMIRKIEEK